MTRCGDRRCAVPSHLTRGPLPAPREWDRRDPFYDAPGPIRRSDWSWQLILEGLIVFVAFAVMVVLMSLVAVE